MEKKRNSFFLIFAFAAFVAMSISSCSTSRKVSDYEVKPMSTNRIVRRVIKEAPNYKNYESKRISVSYDDSESKNSFSGQFQIDYDKSMIVTIRKMNLPVARALITRDSITLINFFEKNYIKEHISIIDELLGVDVGYETIQALFTADVSKFIDTNLFDKTLISNVDNNMYRIDSQFSKKVDKAVQQGDNRKLGRYMQRMDDSEFTNYTAWIDPKSFVLRKIDLNDMKNNEQLTVEYDDYKAIGRSLFPQQILLAYNTPAHHLNLEIKVSRATMNKEKDFSFVVPEKYERYKFSVQ